MHIPLFCNQRSWTSGGFQIWRRVSCPLAAPVLEGDTVTWSQVDLVEWEHSQVWLSWTPCSSSLSYVFPLLLLYLWIIWLGMDVRRYGFVYVDFWIACELIICWFISFLVRLVWENHSFISALLCHLDILLLSLLPWIIFWWSHLCLAHRHPWRLFSDLWFVYLCSVLFSLYSFWYSPVSGVFGVLLGVATPICTLWTLSYRPYHLSIWRI